MHSGSEVVWVAATRQHRRRVEEDLRVTEVSAEPMTQPVHRIRGTRTSAVVDEDAPHGGVAPLVRSLSQGGGWVLLPSTQNREG